MTPREMVEAMVSIQLEVTVLPMGKACVVASERFIQQCDALVELLEVSADLRRMLDDNNFRGGRIDSYDAARAACERACKP